MPTEAEIAWAAGLFEGEGTFTYSPRHIRACLNMTDFPPVERFAQIVGVGTLSHKAAGRDYWKDQLVWRVTDAAGVQHVFEMLRPCVRSVRCPLPGQRIPHRSRTKRMVEPCMEAAGIEPA